MDYLFINNILYNQLFTVPSVLIDAHLNESIIDNCIKFYN